MIGTGQTCCYWRRIVYDICWKIQIPSTGRWAKRLRRISFIGGCTLFGLAILDRLELLPTSVSSEGIAGLIPLDVSPLDATWHGNNWCIYDERPKYWEAEAIDLTRDWKS